MRLLILSVLIFAATAPTVARGATPSSPIALPNEVNALLTRYCGECHATDDGAGDVNLSAFAALTVGGQLDLLNRVQDQMFFRTMPPADAAQPTDAERTALANWLRTELRKHGASKLDDKLRYPAYGNYVDHELLFGGTIDAAPFTPARRWLVSPQIFLERVLDVFQLQGADRDFRRQGAQRGIMNPLVLPDQSGVRYYDNTPLDGGHLLVMLGNAQWITEKQLRAARVKKGELKADVFENPQDRWYPPTTPAAFEKIVLKTEAPSEQEMADAIVTQFDCVLRRSPTNVELRKYADLTREAIALGGNTEGLRQMLTSVLLESEFLYRLEFGAGPPDEHGRQMLSPHEAAFAISYALGDRGPDEALLKAAREGRLQTREDYHREVVRLLADPTYFRGPVDPSLSGKHIHSHVTSHPKLVRFFREFFGYPGALKVFKDVARSGGYYQNPDRGHTGSPGWMIHEADELVIHCLDRDERVFEQLLTTDRYFVYHNMDTKTGRACIASWKQVYDTLKDTAWKREPERVMSEHFHLLVDAKILEPREKELWKQKRAFLSYLYYFQDTFGQGRTPFTRGPFTHGFSYQHSPSYSLPPLPLRGRYEGVETPRYKEPKDHPEYWDYPVEQPFVIAHRKGILTHPSWLIAHSSNFHTDPIRRGRWIREKLLAGSVPDVPITVDAQVPDDPHKTLRERVEAVTQKNECWKCHRHMNPLGLTFECFDDFGRYRTEESREHPENVVRKAPPGSNLADVYQTSPVDTRGTLTGTGDPQLDGDVPDPFELIDRLARSERVRQSIIRHAFRFFLGRNEMPSDSRTLREADRAYESSGGSFQAVVTSLLTSDSFLYRKTISDGTP
jgi:mono/diheme cytochrome c family protein